MKKVLIDSGPLIALFDRSDRYHQASIAFIKTNRAELVTTLASITKVHHLLDFHQQCQLDFLDWIRRGAITIEQINSDDFDRLFELTNKYQDLPMDFADACLVLIGERLNLSEVATIHRDFSIYRIKGKRKFTNIFKNT